MYICQHHQFDYFCLSMAFSPNMPLISQCRPKNVKKSISIPFDHGICFIFCLFKSHMKRVIGWAFQAFGPTIEITLSNVDVTNQKV